MASDPQVDLIFSHFTPRYVATGVDPFDLDRLKGRIDRWDDWCRIWCEEAAEHEALGDDALAGLRRPVSAGESYLRAAIYYHYAKHLFVSDPAQFLDAHTRMLRCYTAAAPLVCPPMRRLEIPFAGAVMAAWLRLPPGIPRPKVAILLPGLDACKEELHAWADAFLARGLATVQLDGPGQGETSFQLPIRSDWGAVIGAVIDVLERRSDVDARAIAVIGQSLGAVYAPLAAAFEPRIKACVANCGPFNFGAVLPQMPQLSQDLFRLRSGAETMAQAYEIAGNLSLEDCAARIKCPLLIVFGGGDRLIPPAEGEKLARAAAGQTDLVLFPEGNHVCFNISYKFRPLTADWTVEHL
jgi:alpha-beta hydrolase superfamily lysophospholipase